MSEYIATQAFSTTHTCTNSTMSCDKRCMCHTYHMHAHMYNDGLIHAISISVCLLVCQRPQNWCRWWLHWQSDLLRGCLLLKGWEASSWWMYQEVYWPFWSEAGEVPEKMGNVCEEGFQRPVWKGMWIWHYWGNALCSMYKCGTGLLL